MTDQPPPGGAYPPPPSSGSSAGHEPQSGGHEPPPPPPPPGGGSYPPPPPPSGGYAPPPPGPAIRTLPRRAYTPWLSRVLAFIIDILPAVIVNIASNWVLFFNPPSLSCFTETPDQVCPPFSPIGVMTHELATVACLFYLIWNFGYRQGTTGSSLGKSVMNFTVLSEVTGQPIGFGKSVLRFFAHFIDAFICYVGFLFPLWDAKRQTLADKVMSTVCLPIEGR